MIGVKNSNILLWDLLKTFAEDFIENAKKKSHKKDINKNISF